MKHWSDPILTKDCTHPGSALSDNTTAHRASRSFPKFKLRMVFNYITLKEDLQRNRKHQFMDRILKKHPKTLGCNSEKYKSNTAHQIPNVKGVTADEICCN